MSKNQIKSHVDFNTLCGGAFAEKVNEAITQVGENIQNMNTDATKKRKINITMTFAPNKTRALVSTTINVTTTLAATEAIDTQMVMGVNMRTGQLEIAEYDGQIQGQMSIGDAIESWKETSEMIDQMVADASKEKGEPDPSGRPLDLKSRGRQQPEKDFDPETGEILEGKSNIVKINKAAEA
jgi:hypothetical protein